jgi:TRAP-type C4-dicarboxylate transport system substrate-binding protein
MLDSMSAMGAVPVAMSQGEVYTAIQQGVLDGAENSEVTFYDLKQYEVAPIYSYTKHFMIPDILVINKGAYDSLSPANKAIFDRLVTETVNKAFDTFIATVDVAKNKAKAEGATFIEDFDAAIFRSTFQSVVDKNIATPDRKKLYDAIKAVK